MSDTHVFFPPPEEGLTLHLRLGEMDPHAVAEVFQAFLVPLLRWLEARWRTADPHFLETAAHDALRGYVQRPQQYDPTRMDLAAFLRMSARRDLFNLLRSERRHHRGRVHWDDVELALQRGNISRSDECPADRLEREEQAALAQALLERIAEQLSEPERAGLRLMLEGERSTPVFAAALGRSDLPPLEQEREVKRFKDRIKARLKRGGDIHA
jgi:DNA-directed RNA polymerase specialized sigma24 family protein